MPETQTLVSPFYNIETNIEKFEYLYKEVEDLKKKLAGLRNALEYHTHNAQGQAVKPMWSSD